MKAFPAGKNDPYWDNWHNCRGVWFDICLTPFRFAMLHTGYGARIIFENGYVVLMPRGGPGDAQVYPNLPQV